MPGAGAGRALVAGPYHACDVSGAAGLAACLALRSRIFRQGGAADHDGFDGLSRHVLITDSRDGAAVACFRHRTLLPDALTTSYAGQFYDLSPLRTLRGPLVELGRVAVDARRSTPDLLRLLFAAMARMAVRARARLIFGCSSFPGADPPRHAPAIAWARGRAEVPEIRALAPCTLPLAAPDPAGVPALLRSYLALGAAVGPDAVADPALDTLHLFTLLNVAEVPAARARTLRRLVGDCLSPGA